MERSQPVARVWVSEVPFQSVCGLFETHRWPAQLPPHQLWPARRVITEHSAAAVLWICVYSMERLRSAGAENSDDDDDDEFGASLVWCACCWACRKSADVVLENCCF